MNELDLRALPFLVMIMFATIFGIVATTACFLRKTTFIKLSGFHFCPQSSDDINLVVEPKARQRNLRRAYAGVAR